MTTAETIQTSKGSQCDTSVLLAQLAPARLASKVIVTMEDGVMITLPRGGKVIVKLNAMDLYDVEVGRLTNHGLDYQVRRQVFGLDCEQLAPVVRDLVAGSL